MKHKATRITLPGMAIHASAASHNPSRKFAIIAKAGYACTVTADSSGYTKEEMDDILEEHARQTAAAPARRSSPVRNSGSHAPRIALPRGSGQAALQYHSDPIAATLARAKAEPDPRKRAFAYAEASRLITANKRN